MVPVVQGWGVFGVGYGAGGGFAGWIEVTLIELVGQAEGLEAAVLGPGAREIEPFTTTQLPMEGYEEGRFCSA